MKILITGAGGFIGGCLTEAFCKEGHQVVALCRKNKPRIPAEGSNQISIIHDISKNIKDLPPVDVIIHTAAHTHLIQNSSANDYVQANVIGMLNLVDYAINNRPKIFINFSTISIYGEIAVGELNEDTPLNKPGMYGLSKYMAEQILKTAKDSFPAVTIRLPGVVGKGYYTPWLGKVLNKCLEHKPITIYNANSLFNNVVDLLEIKKFISQLINFRVNGYEYVNLAATEPITISEVITRIVATAKSRSSIKKEQTAKTSFSISTEKLAGIFGYRPAKTATMIERYVKENLPD